MPKINNLNFKNFNLGSLLGAFGLYASNNVKLPFTSNCCDDAECVDELLLLLLPIFEQNLSIFNRFKVKKHVFCT